MLSSPPPPHSFIFTQVLRAPSRNEGQGWKSKGQERQKQEQQGQEEEEEQQQQLGGLTSRGRQMYHIPQLKFAAHDAPGRPTGRQAEQLVLSCRGRKLLCGCRKQHRRGGRGQGVSDMLRLCTAMSSCAARRVDPPLASFDSCKTEVLLLLSPRRCACLCSCPCLSLSLSVRRFHCSSPPSCTCPPPPQCLTSHRPALSGRHFNKLSTTSPPTLPGSPCSPSAPPVFSSPADLRRSLRRAPLPSRSSAQATARCAAAGSHAV
eukprot:524605-Hanusia_phi.AAC.2